MVVYERLVILNLAMLNPDRGGSARTTETAVTSEMWSRIQHHLAERRRIDNAPGPTYGVVRHDDSVEHRISEGRNTTN
ncbi:hypothetical protein [Halovivax gelatinilyticus]|uniref:hypothetical protein n=1 Tax=Halovivax gelatinilyticus TaxID=2961597 RepID=UPI0020CA4589|nr:hypothetical protein [Halovivax gelatinilyticus]